MTRISGIRTLGYRIILAFIALTGFAQMPIFKRYYIADIPGLGWLARFYVTHALHYGLAAVFIGLCIYSALDFFLDRQKRGRLTAWAWMKSGAILGLVLTGALMVVKNLPGIYFSHATIILLDILHLCLCMALIGAGAFTLVAGKKWLN
ncbi:hypothetical protein [Desulfospira joergensenii]|uniref:hypothetical protein n=1 Tax=Desulfospira joergensenii TaxID=53329 RepID=UPI0003B543DB|nr:hypothetical protein [Desulfospira joergensenii]